MDIVDSTPSETPPPPSPSAAQPRWYARISKFWILPGVGMLCALALLIGTLSAEALQAAKENRCLSNLRSMGQAFAIYAAENNGHWGTSYVQLNNTLFKKAGCFMTSASVGQGDSLAIRAKGLFYCPAHEPTALLDKTKANPDETSSYVLLVPPMRMSETKNSANRILIHDTPGSHDRRGIGVLFCDLHGEFIRGDLADKVLAELAAGQNPPPSLANRKNGSGG